MPSPRPSAVVTLRAKIDTSVAPPSSRGVHRVPITASPPTTNGRVAATTDRYTNSNKTNVRGTAMISARTASVSLCSATSPKSGAKPPTRTSTTSVEDGKRSSITSQPSIQSVTSR